MCVYSTLTTISLYITYTCLKIQGQNFLKNWTRANLQRMMQRANCSNRPVQSPKEASVFFFCKDFTRQRPWQRPEGHYEFPSKTALNSSFLELSWNALKIIYLPHTTLWCTTNLKATRIMYIYHSCFSAYITLLYSESLTLTE